MDIKLFGDKLVDSGSVEGLADRIFKCSVVGANELNRVAETPISRPIWLSIVFEHMFFYLVLAKRHTWAHLPAEKQEAHSRKLNELLIKAVVDYVFTHDSTAARHVEELSLALAARMKIYGKYELMVRNSQAEKPEGTALWEFCRVTAALAGKPDDLVYIMAVHGHIYDSMMVVGMERPTWSV